MSRVCRVKRVSVKGLLCLVFVCLGSVIVPFGSWPMLALPNSSYDIYCVGLHENFHYVISKHMPQCQ